MLLEQLCNIATYSSVAPIVDGRRTSNRGALLEEQVLEEQVRRARSDDGRFCWAPRASLVASPFSPGGTRQGRL